MQKGAPDGFSLVEIMIVVGLIALLAALAIPAFNQSRMKTHATRLAADMRRYAEAFEIYATEKGEWPPDGRKAEIPKGMEGRLPRFTLEGVGGAAWDWEFSTKGVRAGLSLHHGNRNRKLMVMIDEIIDDGHLRKGRLIDNGGRITYILEP